MPNLKLPTPLSHFQMVLTSHGLLIVGGEGNRWDDRRDEILQLKCTDDRIESCSWIPMEAKLAVARSYHVVIPVPDTFECN